MIPRAAGIAAAVLALLVVTPVAAQASECDVRWSSEVTYAVDRTARHISVEARMWPTSPHWGESCGPVAAGFAVVPQAKDFEIVAPVGHDLTKVESKDEESSAVATVEFDTVRVADLDDGVNVTYTIPADDAFVTFGEGTAEFPAWPIDDRAESTVTVTAAVNDVVLLEVGGRDDAGNGWARTALSSDAGWGAAALVHFGSYATEQPDDGVMYHVQRDGDDPRPEVILGTDAALEALQAKLGPRPAGQRKVAIVEVDAGYLDGYAGQYDTRFESVAVDNDVTQNTLLHELAHAWFNDRAFEDPWLAEGLADFLANDIEGSLIDTDRVAPPAASDPGSGAPLATWQARDLTDGASRASVAHGYAASMWVMDRIAAEVGEDRFIGYVRDVVATANETGETINSEEFVGGLQHYLDFDDSDRVVAEHVFGMSQLPLPTSWPERSVDGRFPATSDLALLVLALGAAFATVMLTRSLLRSRRFDGPARVSGDWHAGFEPRDHGWDLRPTDAHLATGSGRDDGWLI